MAFWRSGSESQPRRTQQPGAAKPVTAVFHCTADLSTLVRLRLKAVDAATPAAAAAAGDLLDDDDAAEAAAAAHAAVVMSSLHKLIVDIERKSADARTGCIIEVLAPGTLQLLCQKSMAAKLFKALITHQKALGFALGDVRSCISVTPLGLWELNTALQTAVIKALTGTSTGCSSSNSDGSGGASQPSWMCLSRSRLVAANLLQAAPGLLATAPFVELEALGESPHKLLLTVKAAGSVRFRPFSPMQALAAEPKCLRAPLQPTDTDQQLLQDPAKLAAAARQLDGRAVKLLPDEGVAFIKSLRLRPSNPEQLQQLEARWRGQYGLQLPDDWLFLVGVSADAEAEDAFAQVPSCCVLTSLGLSVLPGSVPGGGAFAATLAQVAAALQDSQLQLWGRLSAERDSTPAGASAAAAAAVQVTQPSQQSADAAAGAAPQQPKQFSFSTCWTTAKDISQLQAAAAAKARSQKQQEPGGSLSAAAAQLMGLQEADAAVRSTAAAAAAPSDAAAAAAERRQQRGGGGSSSEFKELQAFLAARKAEQQEAARAAGGSSASGLAAPPGAGGAASRLLAATAGATPSATGPQQPQFGSRQVFGAAPAAAASAPAARKALPAKPSGLLAAAGAGAGSSAAAAGPAAPAVGGPPKAPALLKRPAAAGAPKPAAKKAKAAAAVSSAAGGAAAAGAKPRKQAAIKAKAPPAPAAADASAPGSAVAAGEQAAAPAAAAAAAGAAGEAGRKRTKASDLDPAAVAAKVAAAFAAGGGSSLKGVSVPEMQCYLRGRGVKGGSAKRADVEARLLALLAGAAGGGVAKA